MGVEIFCSLVIFMLLPVFGVAAQGGWHTAHATFYGDMTGQETMQGACGYGDLFKQGYGFNTAALSSALFNNGSTCGACYQIQCINDPQWCIPGASVTITATNFCPASYSKPNDNWCNPPLKHFDLSMPMFVKLVKDYHCGIIPIRYRRVPCVRKGGIRFEMKGNAYWVIVLVYNVGGVGDVHAVSVKGSKTGRWLTMSRSWGQNWHFAQNLFGQSLSFRVTANDGRVVESDNVVPANWGLGQTFEGKQF